MASLQGHGCDDLAARACLGWGDWNVVAAIDQGNVDRAMRIAKEHGSAFRVVGEFQDGTPRAILRRGDRIVDAPRLESERFAKDSWFTKGIESYVNSLLQVELP